MAGGTRFAPWFSSSRLLALVAAAAALLLYKAELSRAYIVFGLGRPSAKTIVTNPHDLLLIPDTVHCEDLHYHEPSNLLFTACEGTEHTRMVWFPPLAMFDDPAAALRAQGALEVIDPHTMKAKKLTFTNFNGPFVTHGIDIIDDPEREKGQAVYIFAVNHVPSPAYAHDKNAKGHKARSIIEVFHHYIGSDTVDHVRSVWHPLITTPNDILAITPTSFFVTNDHYHREGLLRLVGDVFYGAKWTNVIHVEFQHFTDGSFRDGEDGVRASVAIAGLHNGNGLAHGPKPTDILISSPASGRIHLGEMSSPASETGGYGPRTITIKETIDIDSTVDNPSWFRDPFAQSNRDLSGIVIAGLTSALEFFKAVKNGHGPVGVMVWMAQPSFRGTTQGNGEPRWAKKLLFEDDSSSIRTASAAVLVAIDPAKEHGERKAWLFVTGPFSTSVIAVKTSL
ncbi:hypothetical protein E4U42_005605 [Claviceps africana]|uniref:Serum paraoxonase/arylesterase family protein n=1 Tax=Claviceps africana TaxID=83212 RepID=A0A8K0NG93_9HYPO|nr:hypothetical protein E4U42_005605 [Claviceps africana]